VDKPNSKSLAIFKSNDAKARYVAAYDAALRRWPVPYEELNLPTRLGATHIIASGQQYAPPLVLLPCFMGTATVWRPNVEALSHHFRIYAVDVIGQAGKSAASRSIRNRRDFAGWFTDLLDALSIARTSIIGNSFGGFLALNQASLTPERVDRVVLISPAGIFVSFWRHIIYSTLLNAFSRLTKKERVAGIAAYLGRDVRFDPSDAEWVNMMEVTMSEMRMRGVRAVMPAVFSRAELAAIRAPTLLLIGGNEAIYNPHTTLRRAQDRMPGLGAEIVPGAHHIAAMAKPDYINERIVRFLQRST
jgi:pimeloyl-ACP methyl ester carboxylesterase